MPDRPVALSEYTVRDSYNPDLALPRSVLTRMSVQAPFRRWGVPQRVAVPWGKMDYWNVIASIESIGADEPSNFMDNRFLCQNIKIDEDAANDCWLVSGYSFFTFWWPPASAEPGISIEVRFLAALK